MFTMAQRCFRILAHLDILLFFAVFFGSAITETYICKAKPISFHEHNFDFFGLFPKLEDNVHANISEQTVTQECKNDEEKQLNSSICMPVNYQDTIWDYRLKIINEARNYGMEVYHIVYILFWLVIVTYFVTEIWQYCLLLRGINVRRARFLYKWVTFRIIVLAVAMTIAMYDISGRQVTCTDIFAVPFGGFRFLHLVLVVFFTLSKVQKMGSSSEAIVMTGSEKL
ncbi:uncharacterized protein LOC110848586 [Folsomia candida]|uniref:Uncharacterized protein n=1 Tax=Folsomia candida TaxID=158441 RepID=A0A226EEM7_FOLCA|nr:uncharacterized protein LOC110848586 [Folsomia candida]OXA55281.1 hypothetical protein Fcan01_09643 [Folsomia candida]